MFSAGVYNIEPDKPGRKFQKREAYSKEKNWPIGGAFKRICCWDVFGRQWRKSIVLTSLRLFWFLEAFLLDGVIQKSCFFAFLHLPFQRALLPKSLAARVSLSASHWGAKTACCQHFKLYQLLLGNLEGGRYIYHQKAPPGVLSSRCLGQSSLHSPWPPGALPLLCQIWLYESWTCKSWGNAFTLQNEMSPLVSSAAFSWTQKRFHNLKSYHPLVLCYHLSWTWWWEDWPFRCSNGTVFDCEWKCTAGFLHCRNFSISSWSLPCIICIYLYYIHPQKPICLRHSSWPSSWCHGRGFFPTPAPRTNMKSLSALLGQAAGNGYKSAAFEGPILITVSSGNLGGDSQENFWKQDLVLHLKTLRVGSLKQLYQEVEDQGFQVSHARPTPFFRAWSFWCSWGKTNQINTSPLSSMQEKQNY